MIKKQATEITKATESRIYTIIEGKRVLFATVKNMDYCRTKQLSDLIKSGTEQYDIVYSKRNTTSSRIIEVRHKLRRAILKDYDVIVLGFLPQTMIDIVLKYRKKNKDCLIVSDFFLSLYDTLVDDRQVLKKEWMISKWLKILDRKTLQNSEISLVDTSAEKHYFMELFGIDEKKVKVLYLKANDNIYQRQHEFNNKSNKSEFKKYRIVYFGSGHPLHGIDILVRAIKRIGVIKDHIHVIVIGPIGKKNRKDIESLDYVSLIDWLSQEQLAKQIAIGDLCIAGHFNSEIGKAKRTVPEKAYIYEMMDKPMLLGNSVANHEVFEEDDKHIFVNMGDELALADSIIKYVLTSNELSTQSK